MRESARGAAFHSALLLQHLRSSGHFRSFFRHTLRLNLEPSSHSSLFTLSKSLPPSAGGVHYLCAVPGLDPNPAAENEHVARLKLYAHGRVA